MLWAGTNDVGGVDFPDAVAKILLRGFFQPAGAPVERTWRMPGLYAGSHRFAGLQSYGNVSIFSLIRNKTYCLQGNAMICCT